jgi:hypothetical protein
MAAGLGSLVVSLGLDAADYTQGLTKAEREAERFADNVKRTATEAGKLLGAAAAAGAAGLVYLVKSSIDAADNLNDLSKKTGIAVDTLGGIGFAAGLAGGDLESAAAAAGKLNKTLAEAAAGDEKAAQAFDVLGIAVKDAEGNTISADRAMVAIADRFAKFPDGPEKSALALRLFGKAGADIIPLLDDGGRALQDNIAYYQRFGGVTAETAAAADQFNDTLGKLSLITGAFGRELAAALLPSLQAVADEFLKVKENGTGISAVVGGIKTVFETIVVVGANVAFVFAGVGREIGGIAAQLAALARGDFDQFTAISEAVKEDAARARKELDDFEQRVMRVGGGDLGQTDRRELARRGRGGTPFGLEAAPTLPESAKKPKAPVDDVARYLDGLQKQIERTRELSAVEQVLADIQAKRIKGIDAAGAGKALDLAAQIDAAKRMASQLEAEKNQVEDLKAAHRELAQEGKRVFEATRTPAERYGAELERLNGLLRAGAIDHQTYSRGVDLAVEALDRASEKTKETADETDSFLKRLQENTQDTLGQGLYDALTGNFKNIGRAFLDMLTRMATDAVAAKLAEKMFSGGSTGKGGFGDLLSLFSSFYGAKSGGGINGGSVLPNSLRGGADTGSNYIERDMVTLLHKGEAVVPKRYNPAASGMAGGNVYITNNAPARVSAERDQSGDWQVLIEAAVDAAETRIAAGVGNGTGKVAGALKGRGVNLNGGLARRA